MFILHQYHKASRLKLCTVMCQEKEIGANIFHVSYYFWLNLLHCAYLQNTKFISPVGNIFSFLPDQLISFYFGWSTLYKLMETFFLHQIISNNLKMVKTDVRGMQWGGVMDLVIITGPGHSVDIISTCYVHENRKNYSEHEPSRMLQWSSEFDIIWFFLGWRSTLTNYRKHFPQSVCR